MERLNFSHQNPFPKSGVLKLERLLAAWGGIEQKPGTLLYRVMIVMMIVMMTMVMIARRKKYADINARSLIFIDI